MPDYIVTEVVTYRVTDVADEEAAIQRVIDDDDRDSMFEACLDREAVCISEPIGRDGAPVYSGLPSQPLM